MKAKNKKVLVNFILDKSGSMESVREATISGFNEYIDTLKKDAKGNYEFTLTLFDTSVTQPLKEMSLKDVKKFTNEDYVPNGMTALYDAVCSTIKGVSESKDQKVICIIMTDGQENSSKEYTEVQMKAMIDERTKKGNWTFVYLGANQDSYANAQKFGIGNMNTSNYNSTHRGTAKVMSAMAVNTVAYAASVENNTNAFFSKDDQESLENIK